MTNFDHLAGVAVLLFAGLSISPSTAYGEPPEISGNPGVPGLTAEIDSLQTQLADTESELSETQSDLAEALQELDNIKDALDAALDELAAALEELAVARDELAMEKRRFRVAQTGQNQCWDATSNDPDNPHFTTHCGLTGQDGDARSGLAPPQTRFVDNGDGTVTDNFTQLVWLKNANCIAHNPPDWEQSLNVAGQLPGHPAFPVCGLDDGSAQGDWRVPNVNELLSLVQFGTDTFTGAGLPDGHPFSGFDGYYWTSTTFGLSADFPVSGFVYPCRRKGYDDVRYRFNDAYVVNITTGEVVRMPKESGPAISKRHKTSDGGSCTGLGFVTGSPAENPYAFPTPRFVAVRDAAEG